MLFQRPELEPGSDWMSYCGPAAALAALACRAFARFATSAAFLAGDSFFFATAFFAMAFFATGTVLTAAAFFAAHLFFKAATIAALPAALSLRFGIEGSGVAACDGDSVVPLIAAHRFCCPRAIL